MQEPEPPFDTRSDRDVNHALEDGTIARALHASNNLVVITDPRQEGNPLIWVNDYFCEFTGYTRDEVIGRNCRFLQGEDRSQPERLALAEAVAGLERCHVMIRNYRKDGTLFYNDLYISPVFGDDGEIHYFIGVQNDVTARVDAIRRADDKEREAQETAEDERERFGMDLHDGLGQTLAGSSMLSHALMMDLSALVDNARDLPDELAEQLAELRGHAETLHRHVERTVGETRQMAMGLNPIDASPRGLPDALRALAETIRQSQPGGPELSLDVRDVDFPERRQARHFYRIAQEALSNAIRHAAADHIRIVLDRTEDGVVLEVSDDGRGLLPSESSHSGGRGLPSIQYRAVLIGAILSIDSPDEGGTRVRLTLPLGAASGETDGP